MKTTVALTCLIVFLSVFFLPAAGLSIGITTLYNTSDYWLDYYDNYEGWKASAVSFHEPAPPLAIAPAWYSIEYSFSNPVSGFTLEFYSSAWRGWSGQVPSPHQGFWLDLLDQDHNIIEHMNPGPFEANPTGLISERHIQRQIYIDSTNENVSHVFIRGINPDWPGMIDNVNPVPEPTTFLLLGLGIGSLAGIKRIFRKNDS
jgi:hypothetical protein